MLINKWSFSPGLAGTLATLVMTSVLISLGLWQLDRAEQKREIFQVFQERQSMPQVKFSDELLDGRLDPAWRRVSVSGIYEPGVHVLLDNQMLHGVPGYHVYTAMVVDGMAPRLLVNRGWVPAGAYRDRLPDIVTPDTPVTISGRLMEPPFSGIMLDEDYIDQPDSSVIRTQVMDIPRLGSLLGYSLSPYIVRLEPESATGFERDWPTPGSGQERHLGYAFQWFAMAAAVVVIYLVVNTKKANPA